MQFVQQQLQFTLTKGELIMNTMDLGKTFLTLLYLSYSTLYSSREDHRSTCYLIKSLKWPLEFMRESKSTVVIDNRCHPPL